MPDSAPTAPTSPQGDPRPNNDRLAGYDAHSAPEKASRDGSYEAVRNPLCQECATVVPVPCTAPPEPPVGTWVRDRFGGVTKRHSNGQWAPPGCVPLASWAPMWHARGPLVECRAWGAE